MTELHIVIALKHIRLMQALKRLMMLWVVVDAADDVWVIRNKSQN